VKEQDAGDPDAVFSPVVRIRAIQSILPLLKRKIYTNLHSRKAIGDVQKDIGFFHADPGVVNPGCINNHYSLLANFGLDDVDISGARLEISTNLLRL